jgi:hypothetical protein
LKDDFAGSVRVYVKHLLKIQYLGSKDPIPFQVFQALLWSSYGEKIGTKRVPQLGRFPHKLKFKDLLKYHYDGDKSISTILIFTNVTIKSSTEDHF